MRLMECQSTITTFLIHPSFLGPLAALKGAQKSLIMSMNSADLLSMDVKVILIPT